MRSEIEEAGSECGQSKHEIGSLNKRKDRTSSDRRQRRKSSKEQQPPPPQRNEIYANELQEGDSIVLKVGGDTITVKKEVLIASSQYFKAKFSGYFSDSDAKELDLTKDVDAIEDLKILLDFQENKEVHVTVDNVCKILGISSFFLADSLTDYCAEFMTKTTCLATCVQYYIFAINFALPERYTRKFESFVLARFHDLIIFEDFVAEEINDEDLKTLCTSKILKYCSKESLFNFLLKWLSKSPVLTATQYTLVSGAIQFFEQCKSTRSIPFQCDKKKTMANINRMTDTIRKLSDPELLQSFRELFTNFLRNKEPVFLQMGIHSCDTCVGIFTVSKRVSVNRNLTEDRTGSNCSFYMPSINYCTGSSGSYELFDICVYQPDAKVWFHIGTFEEGQYLSQVDGRPYTPNIEMRKVKKFPVNIFCDIEVTGNEVLFCDISKRTKLVRFDLKNKVWTSFNIDNIVTNYKTHQIVCGKNGVTYLVTRNYNFDQHGIEFRGYTFDFKIPQLHQIFSIKDLPMNGFTLHSQVAEMKAKLSSVSNELLILSSQGHGNDYTIIVDLNPLDNGGKPKSQNLLYNGKLDLLYDDILEIEDRFLVVSSANNVLTTKFQYKFRSKVLENVENRWHYDLPPLSELHSEKWHRFLFKDSCWLMEAEYGYTSRMRKVRIDKSGATDIEEHIPPPFVEPVSVYASEVRKSFFCDLEPVSHFLEHPQRTGGV